MSAEGGPPLASLWTEQHGSSAVDSLQDSLIDDGWERLRIWIAHKNGAVVARHTFSFDRLGNIRAMFETRTHDLTTDRLVARTYKQVSFTYTYDRAGNLTASNGFTYGYDALNQLTSVRLNGTLIARYAYDALGRRIAKRVYSSTTGGSVAYTRFVYRGDHVGFETDSAGVVGLRYVWGLWDAPRELVQPSS